MLKKLNDKGDKWTQYDVEPFHAAILTNGAGYRRPIHESKTEDLISSSAAEHEGKEDNARDRQGPRGLLHIHDILYNNSGLGQCPGLHHITCTVLDRGGLRYAHTQRSPLTHWEDVIRLNLSQFVVFKISRTLGKFTIASHVAYMRFSTQ